MKNNLLKTLIILIAVSFVTLQSCEKKVIFEKDIVEKTTSEHFDKSVNNETETNLYAFNKEISITNEKGNNIAVLLISSNEQEKIDEFIVNYDFNISPVYELNQSLSYKLFEDTHVLKEPENIKDCDINIDIKEISLPQSAFGYSINFNSIKQKSSKGVLFVRVNSVRGYNGGRMNLYSGHINWVKWWARKSRFNRWDWLGKSGNINGPWNYARGMISAKYVRMEVEWIDGADWQLDFINF